MLNRILLCALMLIPSAAFAADPPAEDGSDLREKNICYDIGPNAAKCAAASASCKWDVDDERCEPFIPPVSTCRYFKPFVCNSDSRCVWDTTEGRCEAL